MGSLGLPDLPQEQAAPPDNTHLYHALHHLNISQLGRNIPFGIWAVLNGRLPELAGEGVEPFDWIEHGGAQDWPQ